MRVANRIRVGGVDYVRLSWDEITVELHDGECLKFRRVTQGSVEHPERTLRVGQEEKEVRPQP